MLKVSRQPDGRPEIFLSIQGEGPTVGLPSVFLRLALCNLHCTWCDTKYTWDWTNFNAESEMVALPLEAVEASATAFSIRSLVVTGGEPLLQQRPLTQLLRRLKPQGFRVEIETNGTIAPEAPLVDLVDQWNVSPKLNNSGNDRRSREVAQAYRFFARQPQAYFKFVITQLEDLEEVEQLVARYDIGEERVILMPEGTNTKALQARSRWIADRCVARGFRFSTRLHVLLWGDQRGV